MGKKKSKVSKQKQTKAQKRNNASSFKKNKSSSSLGGVTISKGFSSKSQQSRQQTQQQTSVILHVHNNGSSSTKKNLTTTTANNNSNSAVPLNKKELMQKLSTKNTSPKVFLSPSSSRTQNNNRVALQPRLGSIQEDSSEQDDFDRQMASLQERQWVSEHNQSDSRNSKKKKRGNSKKGGMRQSSLAAPLQMMQSASFSLEKTPEDLLHETMHQMVHMTGVGISAVEKTPIRSNKTMQVESLTTHNKNTHNTALPTMMSSVSASSSTTPSQPLNTSSLAAALRKHQHEQKAFIQQHTCDNPFAALGGGNDDSDDDIDDKNSANDWSLKIQPPPAAAQFQFAPASFTLMPRETPTPASTPIHPSSRLRTTVHRGQHAVAVSASSFAMASPAAVSDGTVQDPGYDSDL